MNTGPGLFGDIGKKARDLLTANYNTDKKFSVNTNSIDNGVVLTSTALKNGEISTAAVAAKYNYKSSLINVQIDTSSNILTTVTLTDLFPSTKAIASFKFPDFTSGKVEAQYFHQHATVTASVALKQSPEIDFTATAGTPSMAFGGEAGYDTKTGTVTKYTAAVSLQKSDAYASVILGDKGDTIRASYVHHLDKLHKNSAVGEIVRKFTTNENIVTVGGFYTIDPLTIIKCKLNNYGTLGAVLQHEIIPKSLLTISTEVNTKALEKTPKFGLSIALVP